MRNFLCLTACFVVFVTQIGAEELDSGDVTLDHFVEKSDLEHLMQVDTGKTKVVRISSTSTLKQVRSNALHSRCVI